MLCIELCIQKMLNYIENCVIISCMLGDVKMSEWRNAFHIIYRLVKSYCSISDEAIAIAVHVEKDSVRQYSSRRQTMPDDIDSLCELFEKEIERLNDINKKNLLTDIQKGLHNAFKDIKCDKIGQHICAMIKQCYSNEKANAPYSADFLNCHESTGHIQAVIFDFDGTLTNAKLRTTWESLWEMLGYDVQECRNLHRQYDKGDFTHQEWCDKTAEKFIEKELTRQQVLELAKKIKLIAGCKKTLRALKERNIKLYIVSGSIKDIIENVLGNTHSFFTEIKANEFIFDTQTSILNRIIGTKYDFEGKANYIQYIANRLGIATSDILFIGNSNNDMWAYQSGANTLCINPTLTNYHDETIWHNTIVECKNLSEILPFIT